MRSATTILLLAALSLAVAGCSSGPAPASPSSPSTTTATHTTTTAATTAAGGPCPPTAHDGSAPAGRDLVFTVVEPTAASPCFRFSGPTAAPSGWVNLTLDAGGHEPHVLVLLRVTQGKTFADAWAALSAADGEQPAWIEDAGGVSILSPGGRATVSQKLEAGTYLMFCWVNGHVGQGMAQELRVTDGADAGTEPQAGLGLTLTDFAFQFDRAPTAGVHTIAVHNAGAQPHEAPLVRLEGNATMMDFAQALEGGQRPPGAGLGGLNPIPPGATAYFTATLAPGRYGLICFVEDPGDHEPHVAKGMVYEFTVA